MAAALGHDIAARRQFGATTKVALTNTAAAKNASALAVGTYRLICDQAVYVRHSGADATAATASDMLLPANEAVLLYVSNTTTTAYVSALCVSAATGNMFLTAVDVFVG